MAVQIAKTKRWSPATARVIEKERWLSDVDEADPDAVLNWQVVTCELEAEGRGGDAALLMVIGPTRVHDIETVSNVEASTRPEVSVWPH